MEGGEGRGKALLVEGGRQTADILVGEDGREVERRGGEGEHDDGLGGGGGDGLDERELPLGEGDVDGVAELASDAQVGAKHEHRRVGGLSRGQGEGGGGVGIA